MSGVAEHSASAWGWLGASVTVLAAATTGYTYASTEAWFELMMLSMAVPAVALLTWAQLRRRSAEAGAAADAMLVPIALGQVFLMLAQ